MTSLRGIYMDAQEWSGILFSVVGAVFLLAFFLVVLWKPRLLTVRKLFMLTVAGTVVGESLQLAGLLLPQNVLLVCGGILASAAGFLSTIFIYVAITSLELRKAGIVVVMGYALCEIVKFICKNHVGVEVSLVLMLVMLAVAPVLAFIAAKPLLEEALTQDAPALKNLTEPSGALSLYNPLFISLFLFSMMFVYTFTDPSYVRTWTNFVPVLFFLVLLAFALAKKDSLSSNRLASFSVFCVFTGCFAMAAVPGFSEIITPALLTMGDSCFKIVFALVLISLCQHNTMNCLIVSTWGLFMNLAGDLCGMFIVSVFGHTAEAFFILFAVFAAFTVGKLMRPGIDDRINTVSRPADLQITPNDAENIDKKCADVAKLYGLTLREQDVAALLARGRNASVIKNELNISYNTARVHIFHIYEKLGVHSQQELIDLIEKY